LKKEQDRDHEDPLTRRRSRRVTTTAIDRLFASGGRVSAQVAASGHVAPNLFLVPSTTSSMYGRTTELGRLESLMQSTIRHRCGVVAVIESGGGTGKTRLLVEIMSSAAEKGFTVLDGLRAPALVTPRPDHRDVDRVNWLIGQVEAQLEDYVRRGGPVLVALDDAQWTEPALLKALGVLAARLKDTSILWLFTLRSDYVDSPSGLAIRNIVHTHRGTFLGPLPPLSGGAVEGVVGDLLGATPDNDVVAICESVGGAPRAIVELVREMCDEHLIVVSDGVARLTCGPLTTGVVAAVEADPEAQMPPPLLRSIQARLSELSPRARDVLQVAAVLGNSFAPDDLGEMLDQRPTQLLAPLQEALHAGLLRTHGDVFTSYREPVWRAMRGTLPAPLRAMLHRQAAAMLRGRPGVAVEDIAAHLVHCAEVDDEAAIATIRQAAELLLPSSPRAAAAFAIQGMRIAARDRLDHLALAITATAALVRLGELAQAIELAQSLLANLCPDDDHRGESESICALRTWLVTALMLRGDNATTPPRGMVEWEDSLDSSDSLTLPSELLLNTALHNHRAAVVSLADRVLSNARDHTDDVRAAALNVRAIASWRNARIDDALGFVEEAVQFRGGITRVWQYDPLWTKAWMLTRIRRLDDALVAAETARRTVDAECTEVMLPIPLALRATILLAKGDVVAAEADAVAGLAASVKAEMPLYEPQLHAVRVMVALRRGDLAMATEGLRKVQESAPADRTHPWHVLQRMLTALIASARQDAPAALAELAQARTDEVMRTQLLLEDPAVASWAVRTALSANDPTFAAMFVSSAERIATTNQSHDTLVAAARHSRALLDRDLSAFADLEGMYGDPWIIASLIEDQGSLQTDRDQAVAELGRAMTAYDRLGAEWDSARVRRKLRQLGVRHRHWNHEARPDAGWDSLTGTEEKVARLVAGGLTNRQVASELFVSPHTVGFHLRQIYRKLSIQSRVDLARVAP
jgi:DNA-binding CsgD family transcriptional regulator